MKICEGCLRQDVCKFKAEVEKYEDKTELPEPLDSAITCKYKEVGPFYWQTHYVGWQDC